VPFKVILDSLHEEVALAIMSQQKELKSNFKKVFECAASIETFMNNRQNLAPSETIKAFVQAIIKKRRY
jgi:hypothetical protein